MKKYFTIWLLLLIAFSFAKGEEGETINKEGYATISGYVKDEKGEELIGANVFVKNKNLGTVSNIYGFYSLTLPKGEYVLTYSFVGYNIIEYKIDLSENKDFNVDLLPNEQDIAEVKITAVSKDVNVSGVGMGMVKLQAKQIKKVPVLFGEKDVIKTIQLLPGVQTMGEGNSGFFVRGGAVDQNLIILDDANVFSPSHIGGIFSVFNGDALKNVELYKGGIPAAFGGRLSSVLDIRMKEGNMTKISGDGGIGLISSRLTLEGPVVKNKSSFLLSGRRTYADIFFPFSSNEGLKNSRFYFYDLNGKFNWVLNKNNRVFISAYTGNDIAKLDSFFRFEYGNITLTARWNHIYNNRLFSNVSLIFSDYDYSIGQPEGANAFK